MCLLRCESSKNLAGNIKQFKFLHLPDVMLVAHVLLGPAADPEMNEEWCTNTKLSPLIVIPCFETHLGSLYRSGTSGFVKFGRPGWENYGGNYPALRRWRRNFEFW